MRLLPQGGGGALLERMLAVGVAAGVLELVGVAAGLELWLVVGTRLGLLVVVGKLGEAVGELRRAADPPERCILARRLLNHYGRGPVGLQPPLQARALLRALFVRVPQTRPL